MKKKFLLTIIIVFVLSLLPTTFGCAEEEGNKVNLVIQVEFADTQSSFSFVDNQNLQEAFHGDDGLDKFIEKNTNKNHWVESRMLGVVRLAKEIDHFTPRYRYDTTSQSYEEVNSKGYDNRYFDEEGNPASTGKQSVERYYREQELVYLVSRLVNESLSSEEKKTEFENVTLVLSWLNRDIYRNDIFYPHQANGNIPTDMVLSAYQPDGVERLENELKIGRNEVGSYIIIPYASFFNNNNLSTNTICHEYMHVLGVPDMYPYDRTIKPVGEFDVMGGEATKVANQSLAYIKYKKGWLKEGVDILPVTGSGEYSLTAIEDDGGVKAYKITPSTYYEKGDVFYLEYRKLAEGSLSNQTTEGVIIYRVNEENGYISSSGEKAGAWRGNAYGDYEVIVFRNPQDLLFGNHTTLADEDGYRAYGNVNGSTNVIFYSDGENSKIKVEYLGKNEDGTVKVKITLPEEEVVVPSQSVGLSYDRICNKYKLYFNKADKNVTAHIVYSDKRVRNATAQKLIKDRGEDIISVNTTFLKVDLSKYQGLEQYVYLFYEEDGIYSQVEEYKLAGIKNINVVIVLGVAVVVGIAVPSATLTLISKISKKRRENNDRK